MIYYHPELNKALNNIGISIPLSDLRATQLFFHLDAKLRTDQKLSCSLKSLSESDLLLIHSPRYCDELLNTPIKSILKCYEGYCSEISNNIAKSIVNKVLQQAYGTYEAMKQALKHEFVYYLGGGMHHAMKDNGRGFCLIHDIAIAIKKLQQENLLQRVWIIDVDAHKGDGTAEIFENDLSVKTLSIHMADGWPLDGSEDERSLISSTVDIPISNGIDYQVLLERGVQRLLDNFEKPDLVCIVNGMDAWEGDELPGTKSLRISAADILARDQYLHTLFKKHKLPQLYVMAGGYGQHSWKRYADFLDWALEI